MSRVHAAPGPEPDPDAGDPVATFLRRRPVRAGTVLTQPPPPPPVPIRVPDAEDEPTGVEARPRPEADVVADIDRLIADLNA